MKRTRICPKCNSSAVYTNEHLTKRGERSIIPITGWRGAFISVYACLDCGYFEEYLAESELNNPKIIDRIKSEWKRADL